MLMSFSTKLQAIEYAHTFYTTPVMQGEGAIIQEYVRRLLNGNNRRS